MSDEQIQDATLTEEPMTSETTTDVEDVIQAEATEDTGDFDEPQASEIASAEVDTVDEGEDETAEAVEEAIDAADTDSLEEGLSGTAEADIAAEDAALAAEESQAERRSRAGWPKQTPQTLHRQRGRPEARVTT